MATFIEQLEQETSKDAVEWLRSKPMEIYQDELYNPESIQQTPAPSSYARTSLASQGGLLSPQRTNLNNLIQAANSSHMSARAASPTNSLGPEVEAGKRQAEDHTKAMTAPLASDSFPDNGKSMGPPQGTMNPQPGFPWTTPATYGRTVPFFVPIFFHFSHLIVWLHGYDTPPEQFQLLHRLIRTNTTTTFFDRLICTEQHAEPVPIYHSTSPPEQQHAQWCLRSSSQIPPFLTSMGSTKSKSLLPIYSVATAMSSPYSSRSLSVASELNTLNPPFYSFALSWCEEGTPLPNYLQAYGTRLHSNCNMVDL